MDRNRRDAQRLDRVVVATLVESVTEEQDVVDAEVEDVHEFVGAVGLVDALLGDVDRRGPAAADLEVGQSLGRVRAQRLLLGTVGIPGRLGVDRSRLSQRAESDLTAAILQDRPPGLRLPEPQLTGPGLQYVEGALLLVVAEVLRVDGLPRLTRPADVLGAAGRHEVQITHRLEHAEPVEDLRLELAEATAGDDASQRVAEHATQQRHHVVGQGALRRRECVVEIEHDQSIVTSLVADRHPCPLSRSTRFLR